MDVVFCWTVILAATTCWEAVQPRVGTMHFSTLIVSIQKEESISIYKQLKSRGWCTQQSKATCSLFLIKMIAKVERTQKTAQQNMEQPQTPPPHTHTMGTTINNSHFVGGGSLSTFNWYQVFAQDYKVLLFKHKNCLNSGFLVTIAMYYH